MHPMFGFLLALLRKEYSMSRDRIRWLSAWVAVLGLVMLSGCFGRPGAGPDKGKGAVKPPDETPPIAQAAASNTKTDRGNGAGKPPGETPPTALAPVSSSKGDRDMSPPTKASKDEAKTVGELIAAAKELKPGAVEALAAAGPQAIPAILAELRRDDRRFSWAVAAMARMGPDAVEPVAALLNDSDYFMRKIAYQTLGEMGPIAMPAVPALQRAAQQDGDPRNRGLAANAISQITRR
jgi:hypothetical protein